MPVLHQYKNRQDYYILTSIGGKVVTFQLTTNGVEKVLKSGIALEKPFGRAILLDLCRSGDAYTYGSGVGGTGIVIDERQMELDFSNDPDSETMFPSCAGCLSMQDLHIVEVKDKDHLASILCADCRSKQIAAFDTSIPLPLVSRAMLSRLMEMKGIEKLDASATAYKELLDAEFESKWDAYKRGKPEQGVFDVDTGKQDRLL